VNIYSKFKDYYDTVLSAGRDDTISYKRQTEEIKDREAQKYFKKLWEYFPWTSGYKYHTVVFAFCGKIYVGYQEDSDIDKNNKTYYTIHAFEKSEGYKKLQKERNDKGKFWMHRYKNDHTFNRENVERVFTKYNSGHVETDLNIKYKTPLIIAVRKSGNIFKSKFEITSNPPLYKYSNSFLNSSNSA